MRSDTIGRDQILNVSTALSASISDELLLRMLVVFWLAHVFHHVLDIFKISDFCRLLLLRPVLLKGLRCGTVLMIAGGTTWNTLLFTAVLVTIKVHPCHPLSVHFLCHFEQLDGRLDLFQGDLAV